MLLILFFCFPLKILVKAELNTHGFDLGIYLYGFRIINVLCNLSKKTFSINNKRKSLKKIVKRFLASKDKKKSKYSISPKIISDLNIRFFVNRLDNVDASDWAIQNAVYKSLPDRLKISVKKSQDKTITFSIYGFFTLFQIISSLIANTKRR